MSWRIQVLTKVEIYDYLLIRVLFLPNTFRLRFPFYQNRTIFTEKTRMINGDKVDKFCSILKKVY